MDAEQYRRKAQHYLICARQMMSPANRAMMIELAAIWMRLAERARFENQVVQQPQPKDKAGSLAAAAKLNDGSSSWSNIILFAWGCAVPVDRLVTTGTFGPEQVAALGGVFEAVLRALGLIDRQDPLTEMVARKVIELAQTGERDPVRLKQLTLEAFEERPN